MPLSPRRSPRTVNGVTNRPSTSSATPGLQRQPNGQTRVVPLIGHYACRTVAEG